MSHIHADAAVLRQSLSLLDYHFLQEKPLHPLSRLYAERISNYLSSNNEQSVSNTEPPSNNSQNRVYTCSQCLKQFRHAGSLAQHVRMHTNIENFRCPICMKVFSRIYDMKTHVKIRHPDFLNSNSS